MIHALLIYDRPRLDRNQWFAQTFQKKCSRCGWHLQLKLAEEMDLSKLEYLPDAVFMRCLRPQMSRYLETLGVRVFNSAAVSKITNDKLETFHFFRRLGIPVMESRELDFRTLLPFPFVLKTVDGHGGSEVFLVNSETELQTFIRQAEHPTSRRWLIQRLADTPGRDVRVYVVGNQIIAAMERTSQTDFRSNYSLGGSAKFYALNSEEKALVSQIISFLPLDFAGVDLIFHQNQPVLNEIEDVVGTRMLYSETEIDILEIFLDYAEKEILRRK